MAVFRKAHIIEDEHFYNSVYAMYVCCILRTISDRALPEYRRVRAQMLGKLYVSKNPLNVWKFKWKNRYKHLGSILLHRKEKKKYKHRVAKQRKRTALLFCSKTLLKISNLTWTFLPNANCSRTVGWTKLNTIMLMAKMTTICPTTTHMPHEKNIRILAF